MKRGMLGALCLLLIGADAPPQPIDLHLVLTGLRSSKGMVRLCLWRDGAGFPNCHKGQDVRMEEAPAAPTVRLDLSGLSPGAYAVSLIHDENDNRRLDKSLIGIPTEGVGFSRNPAIVFGAPSFKAARFEVTTETAMEIRMKYFL